MLVIIRCRTLFFQFAIQKFKDTQNDNVVSENTLMRRIFGSKKHETRGEWMKLHNGELLYSSPNIVRMIRSRIMRWVRHVTLTEEGKVFAREN
jgi:hypothetical protein